MSKWISVNEKLPKANIPVLVHYQNVFRNDLQSVAIHLDGKEWRQLIGGSCFGDGNLTHWMSLPEPPKPD